MKEIHIIILVFFLIIIFNEKKNKEIENFGKGKAFGRLLKSGKKVAKGAKKLGKAAVKIGVAAVSGKRGKKSLMSKIGQLYSFIKNLTHMTDLRRARAERICLFCQNTIGICDKVDKYKYFIKDIETAKKEVNNIQNEVNNDTTDIDNFEKALNDLDNIKKKIKQKKEEYKNYCNNIQTYCEFSKAKCYFSNHTSKYSTNWSDYVKWGGSSDEKLKIFNDRFDIITKKIKNHPKYNDQIKIILEKITKLSGQNINNLHIALKQKENEFKNNKTILKNRTNDEYAKYQREVIRPLKLKRDEVKRNCENDPANMTTIPGWSNKNHVERYVNRFKRWINKRDRWSPKKIIRTHTHNYPKSGSCQTKGHWLTYYYHYKPRRRRKRRYTRTYRYFIRKCDPQKRRNQTKIKKCIDKGKEAINAEAKGLAEKRVASVREFRENLEKELNIKEIPNQINSIKSELKSLLPSSSTTRKFADEIKKIKKVDIEIYNNIVLLMEIIDSKKRHYTSEEDIRNMRKWTHKPKGTWEKIRKGPNWTYNESLSDIVGRGCNFTYAYHPSSLLRNRTSPGKISEDLENLYKKEVELENNFKKLEKKFKDVDDKVLGVCSDGIGGQLYTEQTKKACLSWAANKKEYKRSLEYTDENGEKKRKDFVMDNKLKEDLLWKPINNKNQFYTNSIHKHCQPWIDDKNKKDPSKKCLQAIGDSNGCKTLEQEKTDFTRKHNFQTLYLDSQWYFVRGCEESGITEGFRAATGLANAGAMRSARNDARERINRRRTKNNSFRANLEKSKAILSEAEYYNEAAIKLLCKTCKQVLDIGQENDWIESWKDGMFKCPNEPGEMGLHFVDGLKDDDIRVKGSSNEKKHMQSYEERKKLGCELCKQTRSSCPRTSLLGDKVTPQGKNDSIKKYNLVKEMCARPEFSHCEDIVNGEPVKFDWSRHNTDCRGILDKKKAKTKF